MALVTPAETEYLWIRCFDCGERCKLAKDKGGGVYKIFAELLATFLLEHHRCQVVLEAD